MQDHLAVELPAADPPRPDARPGSEPFVDTGRHSLPRRLLTTGRHLGALALGGLAARARAIPTRERRRPGALLLRALAAVLALPVDRALRREPFPVQLRVRLERLGATYIKLGQILSMREDLLPSSVTGELRRLLDRAPAVPHPRVLALISEALGRPVDEVFAHVRSEPLGSASIGQTHVATTLAGEQVILKIVKPGVRATLRRDTRLLRALGWLLQLVLPRYQPRYVLAEFCDYTLREVDLRLEADNAEAFAAAFADRPQIVFPEIHREHSNQDLLCMEYLDGIKPTDARALQLPEADRRRLVDLGAEAIISMLYRDGFFHADLHPGNLLILPGPSCGFIDLGMVGQFDGDLKHALLYYYASLVAGDAESAAGYLASIATTRGDADVAGFRRDVEEICRRWSSRAHAERWSLARLIMQSVSQGARHGLYFPMSLVLMVKAIVTFEAVGQMLVPGFDVASVSRRHVNRIIIERFGPLRLARESVTALPELLDALAKTPRLLTEGLRLLERTAKAPESNPFAGMRATLFGGFCMVAGAILVASGGPWPAWSALFALGLVLSLRRGG